MHRWRYFQLTVLILFAATLSSDMAWGELIPEASEPAMSTSADPTSESTWRLLLQLGFMYRLSGSVVGEYDEFLDNPFLLTFELGGFRWDGHSPTWGLAARAAFDELGFRLGPEIFGRVPLGSNGKSYVQLGITPYLFSGDSDLADWPGWGANVEIAPSQTIAFVLGLESLRYQLYDHYSEEVAWTGASGTNWYAGVKSGNWVVLVIVAVLYGLGAALWSGGATGP